MSLGTPGVRLGIVCGVQVSIGFLDGLQDTVTSGTLLLAVSDGNRPLRTEGGGIANARVTNRQGTRVGLVKREVGLVDLVVGVTCLVGDNLQQVGTAIPATQGRKTPVGGDTGNGGVVSVEGIVLGTLEVFRNGTAYEDAEDTVAIGVGLVLIEGQKEKSVVVEVLVLEQLGHPKTLPLSRESDVGVMRIVGHVRSDESPLRKLLVLDIIFKVIKALDLTCTAAVGHNRVIKHHWVVLANVIGGISFLVRIVVALETGIGNVLLVFGPRDALGVKQISNARNVARDLFEVIIIHSKRVTASGSAVVGLGGMSDSIEVGPKEHEHRSSHS